MLKWLKLLLFHLQTVVDSETGEPGDALTGEARAWCQSIGSEATAATDIVTKQDPVVMKAIQGGIDKANSKAVSRAQKIQKWSILPTDFSIPGGELGM